MPLIAEAPAPTEALILPSPEESTPLEGMPKAEQLSRWQNFVESQTKFHVKDKKSALIQGSEGAMLCEYVIANMFPEHNTIKRTVKYRFNVVMLVDRKGEFKNLPLPSFFIDADKFFNLFVQS